MQNKNISEPCVQIIRPQPDGLVEFGSVLFYGVRLTGIGIYQRADGNGYRCVYPIKTLGNKKFNIFYPADRETGSAIEAVLSKKLIDVMEGNSHKETFAV